MSMLVKNLTCGYKGRAVVRDFSACVEEGSVFCLLGPNGVGKTTLFRTMLGLLPALGGTVEVDGQDVLRCQEKRRAQLLAYVPQSHTPPFAFTAADVVVMGASATGGLFGRPGASCYDVARHAMETLSIDDLADRPYTELSGGQRQMVLIARAVAQGARYLMMDEPCASLDLGNEARVLAAVRSLAKAGLGVVMTTHSPAHVAQCDAHGVLLMREGKRLEGGPADLLTPEALSQAYGVPVAVAQMDFDARGHAMETGAAGEAAACGQGELKGATSDASACRITLCQPLL